MKKNRLLGRFVVAVLVLITTVWVQAGSQPKFSILPIVRAPTMLPINSIATAQYLVINNTALTRTLTMVPIPGINQNGGCPNPFTLASGQSCLLSLQLMPLQMAVGGVHLGPEVCKTVGPHDTRPDAFLCSQPSPADMFNVTIVM